MNIGMILNGEYPPDIRVEKECDALIQNKQNNIFILSGTKELRPDIKKQGIYKNVVVCYTAFDYPDKTRKNLNRIKKEIGIQTLVQKKILEFVNDYKIDVIHAHDLPMANAAMKIARIKKIPLISDLHENYPFYQLIGQKKNILNFKKWLKIEKKTTHYSDFIITTCDEMKNRIIREHKVNPQKIVVVSNVYADEFRNFKVHDFIEDKYKKRKMFLYSGIINIGKGCKTLIEAITYLKKYPEILLCLVGVSKEDKKIKYLRDMVSYEKVEDQVEFVQWQPLDKIYSYIMSSYACIVPFERNMQNDCSSPHKLFQYLACGKPVIVSDCPSIANIIVQNRCGLVFKSGDSKDLAEKILALYRNNQMQNIMGKNGAETVKNKYNFSIEGEKILSLYKKIIPG